MNNTRNLALWLIIILLLVVLFNLFSGTQKEPQATEITYSDFLHQVDAGQVTEVSIQSDKVTGKYGDGSSFVALSPWDPALVGRLEEAGVSFTGAKDDGEGSLMGILLSWLPMFVILAIWIFVLRQMQSGSGKAMGFGKSKAKLLTEGQGNVTFEDVAGIDEAKEELQEIVEFLREPSKFQKLGGKIPKGALLVGPPGTGKTLLARAVAGEARVPFFTISGSDFVEMFVGVGASRVRDMFEQAKRNAPCIVFIDEIDAVGRHRGAGLGGGNDEREQTLNQLLVEMDGFESNEGVILIAATNRPDVLDPALLRPGRFDRQVTVPNPDIIGREKILRVHIRNIPIAPDVNMRTIARGTPGFSGADLANLANEAALLAARRNKRLVTMQDFEDAKDKVMMGAERRSMVMDEEEKRSVAYHEGGHALVAIRTKGSDPVHKATIIPRGQALGMVLQLPEKDRTSYKRVQMTARLAVMMGGRVAEEEIFGYDEVSSGASSDISGATNLARAMVTQWGMSDKLGPLAYGENQQEVFLGHSVAQTQNMSDETMRLIDAEVRRFVETGYKTAQDILRTHANELEIIAQGLLEYETLSGDEIEALLKGKQPSREDLDNLGNPSQPSGSVPSAGHTVGGSGVGEPQPT